MSSRDDLREAASETVIKSNSVSTLSMGERSEGVQWRADRSSLVFITSDCSRSLSVFVEPLNTEYVYDCVCECVTMT